MLQFAYIACSHGLSLLVKTSCKITSKLTPGSDTHPRPAECADVAGPEDDAQRQHGGAAGGRAARHRGRDQQPGGGAGDARHGARLERPPCSAGEPSAVSCCDADLRVANTSPQLLQTVIVMELLMCWTVVSCLPACVCSTELQQVGRSTGVCDHHYSGLKRQ
jgi:hypothetical protein